MRTVKVLKHLDSENVNLPEARELVGTDVEITIRERDMASEAFWRGYALEELSTEQNTRPASFEELLGGWPDDPDDGFEQALQEWRREE